MTAEIGRVAIYARVSTKGQGQDPEQQPVSRRHSGTGRSDAGGRRWAETEGQSRARAPFGRPRPSSVCGPSRAGNTAFTRAG